MVKEIDYGKKWLSSIYLVSPRQLGDGGWDEKEFNQLFRNRLQKLILKKSEK